MDTTKQIDGIEDIGVMKTDGYLENHLRSLIEGIIGRKMRRCYLIFILESFLMDLQSQLNGQKYLQLLYYRANEEKKI